MRKQFYLDIVERLKLIVSDQDVPIIKHYDLWNLQLNPDWTEQFRFPAVFLQFNPISWKVLGRKRQDAIVDFNLHICNQTKARSSDKSPFRDKALAHLDLIDAIHYWLTGFRGDYFGSIYRISSAQPNYYLDTIRHVETYRMQLVDDTAVRETTHLGQGDRLVLNISFDN